MMKQLDFFLSFSGLYLVMVFAGSSAENERHPCHRPCPYPPEPKECKYDFKIESYYVLSRACFNCPLNKTECLLPHCIPLNGVKRSIMTVNRVFPGPSIEVCERDKIIVKVTNHLRNSEGTSIHWHGLHLKGEQYMDGVSMLTQCPIPAGDSFTYNFTASNPGTHYWHAHAGLQRADGIFGALTIRQPRVIEKNNYTYDHDLAEHKMLLTDWLDIPMLDKYIAHIHSNGNNRADSLLVNGKGQRQKYERQDTNDTIYTDREVFHVEKGYRYRFRIVSNAIANCPIKVSIDSHNMTAIASDGSAFKPFETEILTVFAGERFDIVVHANQTIGNYWIRYKGLANCGEARELAILRYKGALDKDPMEGGTWDRQGLTLNPWNTKQSELNIPIYLMDSLESNDETSRNADKTYFIGMDFNKVDNTNFFHKDYYPLSVVPRSHHVYSPQLNGVSFVLPSVPPLSQYDDIIAKGTEFCTPKDIEGYNCTQNFCECTHVIHAKIGQVIEFVIVDEGKTFNANHPMHLHGHPFRVVAVKKIAKSTTVTEVKKMHQNGTIHRKLEKAPKKDSVTVPDGGYTIIRFYTNNPGWWLFHCHVEFHIELGMSMIVHVGEQTDLPPVPKDFPSCGVSKTTCDKKGDNNTATVLQNLNVLLSLSIFIAFCLL